MRNVAILLFDEIEVLDFAGPFEVFGVAGRSPNQTRFSEPPFAVFTVAETTPVNARNGLSVNPAYRLDNHPKADIIIVPGGGGFQADGTPFGSRREMNNPVVLNWVRQSAERSELVLSVCTGSFILGKAGLLDGLAATTHFMAIDGMRQAAPDTELRPAERYIDNGKIVTSAGISAGIDMSLYVVSRLLGKDVADETARYMQYDYWQ
ncbi:DJ-1/PfpI family protein [Spirosoma luteum]|uniref:DJ-1/PfpI family protein n=1 Tax=Spirosoma luteum TaxID=431553 RepID=UPI0003801AA5|nr:DJ-1/PfpI family protein [Spirosoma luteum]